MRGYVTDKLLLVLIAVLMPVLALGDDNDVRRQIFTIKTSGDYMTGEGSDENRDMAYDTALRELTMTINSERKKSGGGEIASSDIITLVSELTYMRGELTAVFLYIDRQKALNLSGKTQRPKPGGPGNQGPDKPQDKPNQPDDGKNVEKPTPKPEPQPKEEAKPELKPQPKQDPPQPKPDPPQPKPEPLINNAHSHQHIVMNVLEREMAADVNRYLKTRKTAGDISDYGVAHSLNDIKDEYYLVIFDQTGAVRAVLAPSEGKRLNLRTNAPDDLSNYPQCAVMWWCP